MKRWWYVLIGPLTLGIVAWAAFLYMGIKGRQRLWLTFAAAYFAAAVGGAILMEIEGEDATFSGFVWIVLAVGSFVHTLALRPAFEERMELLEDPSLDVAEDRAERQQHAREIAASDPRRARQLGIGRPDREHAFHAGLVDVNGAPPGVIAEVAGVSRETAEMIVAGRPYSSVEDLDLVVNLPREQLAKLRDVAVFLPAD